MSNTAIGYTRLSQDGLSIPRQKEQIREYCEQNGLELDRIYDDGRYQSGYDDEREAYAQLKERVNTDTGLAAVVVRDGDRLGRDFDERMDFILTLRRGDLDLHTAERGWIDLSDPYEAAIEGIHAASADEQKRREIERAKRATQERLDQGYDHGRPPFGLRYDDSGRYWIPGADFEVAKEVLLFRDRGKSYSEIADSLNVSRSTAKRIVDRRRMYEELDENPYSRAKDRDVRADNPG